MPKTILVPLDGSALAERALPEAEALARQTGAALLLVRILPLPTALTASAGAAGEAAPEARAFLDRHAGHLVARGLVTDTRVIYGDPAEAILQEAASRDAATIVMATHGRTGLGRLVFGSVAEAVLRRATAPLLLVRAWDEDAAPPPLAAHPRVLVPLDGSPFAEEALPVAANLTMALGGELVLLHAISPIEPVIFPELAYSTWPEGQEERLAAGREYLHDLVARSATGGCPVHFDVRLDVPTLAIAEAAREHGAALMVMATHGRGALGRLALGGVAHATLTHTRMPLLLIRPRRLPTGDGAVAARPGQR
jgi:nucleotide-binding universal stress UspA family protein